MRRCTSLTTVTSLAVLLVAPGCYYTKLAASQLALVNRQRPLPDAAALDPDPARRAMLALVPSLRAYARNTLQLPVAHSYTGYYQTEAKGILFVVVGSERLRLEAYSWWFPVVGTVDYKAFTDEADAQAEADRLERAGFDAYIGRVTAYSTLGVFRDPVTSIMMRHGTASFIEVLFHEMAHARLYVPGHTDFNEQFASFVGQTAAEDFIASRCAGKPVLLASIDANRRERDQIAQLIRTSLEELDTLYGSGQPAAQILRDRELVFARLQAEFGKLYPNQDKNDLKVNNARLLQYRRYISGVDQLEGFWKDAGGSWPRFYRLVEDYVEREL